MAVRLKREALRFKLEATGDQLEPTRRALEPAVFKLDPGRLGLGSRRFKLEACADKLAAGPVGLKPCRFELEPSRFKLAGSGSSLSRVAPSLKPVASSLNRGGSTLDRAAASLQDGPAILHRGGDNSCRSNRMASCLDSGLRLFDRSLRRGAVSHSQPIDTFQYDEECVRTSKPDSNADEETTVNRKKLLFLILALAASVGALVSAPAAANHRCGWVCSAPGCCVFCCIEWPCALPICN